MPQQKKSSPDKANAIPQYWSKSEDGSGAIVLTHAIRGGWGQYLLTGLGGASLLLGLWGIHYLSGGDSIIAAIIVILLLPGSAIAFGLYCLNIAWWRRTEYAFSRHAVTERICSLWGNKIRQVERSRIKAISQNYSPPPSGSAASNEGTWATLIEFTDKQGKSGVLSMDGLDSKAEARWLGPWISAWAGISLRCGFSDADQEADAKDLPALED